MPTTTTTSTTTTQPASQTQLPTWPFATPEVLAPAGDFEAMKAAVLNGAHAVYFGVQGFNARYRATNFTLEQLPEVMAYLHEHNVRGYVTFNILIFSDELTKAAQQITAMAQAGVDGVIVQDLGLAELIHTMAPDLPIHGSTQMTLTEPLGVRFVAEKLGVRRVVLGRELSIDDIKKTSSQSPVPVEAFAHGALCVAYSGQCLTSESLGGRSANRGMCAQACRLPYDLVVDDEVRDLGDIAYLVSPKDLAAYDIVPEMLDAGVKSFKIEGRLKSPHYVAAATRTYRAALDAALNHQPFALSDEQAQDLAQSFSRGFSHGFLDGTNHQVLVEGRFPKKRGLRLGHVIDIDPDGVIIQLTTPAPGSPPGSTAPNATSAVTDGQSNQSNHVNHDATHLTPSALPAAGIGVVFDEGHPEQDEQGGRVIRVEAIHAKRYELGHHTTQSAGSSTNRTNTANANTYIKLSFHPSSVDLDAINPGAIVWKTDDPVTRKRLEQTFNRETVVDRQAVSFTVTAIPGCFLKIQAQDTNGKTAEVENDAPLDIAQKRPLTDAIVHKQLSRLGNTPYELDTITLIGPDGPCQQTPAMVPISVLNELRRQVIQQLSTKRIQSFDIKKTDGLHLLRQNARTYQAPPLTPTSQPTTTEFIALCRTIEQVQAALQWQPPSGCSPLSMLYVDFEDVRRYKLAVEQANQVGMPIAVGTMRILKPNEHGYLKHILACKPDAVLVRNLASILYLHEHASELPLIADYSLNISNELTAAIFARQGVERMVPSYDLSWQQMLAMIKGFDPNYFEVVVHQHMPMFHMEHCVFAHTMSDGADYRTCGRPCESHSVKLRDRVGIDHPLTPDNGCRNTLYNAQAQSAAAYIPRMLDAGLKRFRVEMLLEDQPKDIFYLLNRYAKVIAGLDHGQAPLSGLNVLNQLGVTSGTFDRY